MTTKNMTRSAMLARLRLLRESRDVLDAEIHRLSDALYPEGELARMFDNYENYAREMREAGAL